MSFSKPQPLTDIGIRHIANYRRTELGTPRGRVSRASMWALEHFHARRQRNKYFIGSLFRDPAWDLLLDLYLAEVEGRPVRVSDASRVASPAPSTGLRWIILLEEADLLTRIPDAEDARATFLKLTDKGWDSMSQYLQDACACSYSYEQDEGGQLRVKRQRDADTGLDLPPRE